ncbi:hypothetical protein GQ43DRAFT_145278 [Delitschia confertaspora ATCC 74209]|uniref:Uncharacterized protein n=1 Tax=Delitschia confertaspora ATCC 74209 TaxID=1513339 RepID=A0A9P4JI87_9PLEO|nr:hypothetical protein GQ43DRAFT_145278 [Delitschia confertaspora ATCC 74209]
MASGPLHSKGSQSRINTAEFELLPVDQNDEKPFSDLRYDSDGNGGLRNDNLPPRPKAAHYRFKRYIFRLGLNTIFPIFITLFYLFVLKYYIWKPIQNDISPTRPIPSKGVFFAWLIISIFVLDWAKAGLSGFEAAALMKPTLAPRSARQFLWHMDRGWGSVGGWWKASRALFLYVTRKFTAGNGHVEWDGPGGLWFYLAFSSILFYAAVPLSGLSMDPKAAFRLSNRPVQIFGTNQSTFDIRSSNDLAESASTRWRQGYPTAPEGVATFLYAPHGTKDATGTYYEDAIQTNYQARISNMSTSQTRNQTITFFSGPAVSERAYGKAWGMLVSLSCMPAHPYKDMKRLNVTGINNWEWRDGAAFTNSEEYGNLTTLTTSQAGAGASPLFFDVGQGLGVDYQYLMSSDRDISMAYGEYLNGTTLPIIGETELVMWQTYNTQYGRIPDENFKNMSSHPLVVSSVSIINNLTYLGYGVRCWVNSTVGTASISTVDYTFDGFKQQAADRRNGASVSATPILTHYPGVAAIQSIVFAAFTTLSLGYIGGPKCSSIAIGCNPWIGANLATGGVPSFIPVREAPPGSNTSFIGGAIQDPSISPERMALAMYKLFGEVAIAAMANGPGNWTSAPNATSDLHLYGLEPFNDIENGRVPYQVVLVLLLLWTAVTVIPQLLPGFFLQRRWGDTLDGFAMFRFGAEWANAVHRLQSTDLQEPGTACLRDVPGMIGDMNGHGGAAGFVGLSRRKASLGRDYCYSPQAGP